MNYQDFENHISQTLQNDAVSLDINALLDDIHKKKSKRRFLFFIMIVLAGVLSSGFLIYTSRTLKGVVQQAEVIKSSETQSGDDATECYTNKFNTVNNNYKNAALDFITETKQSSSSKDGIFSSGYKDNNANSSGFENKSSMETVHLSDATTLQDKEVGNAEGEKEHYPLTSVAGIGENKVSFVMSSKKSTLTLHTDKIVCPSFSNKGKLLVELIPEFGLFLPLKKLENTSPDATNIFNLRDKNEKSLEGWQAALYMKMMKTKSPFYIKAGLSYSQLTEKMPLRYSYMKKDTTQGIISITVSQTGDTITTIYGDIVRDKKISGSKTVHHTFNLFDVPLAVGLEKKLDNWIVGAEFGVMVNISLQSKGGILATDTSFVDVNIPNTNFNKSIGLNYFGGINIGRDFEGIGRFYLAARARIIPNSFSGDQNRIRQSYNFVGLHLGYVYTFR